MIAQGALTVKLCRSDAYNDDGHRKGCRLEIQQMNDK